MLRLITDFDGPIMDVSQRYYRVYQHCLGATRWRGQQVHMLPKEEFWALKRSRVPERKIGMLSGLDEEQGQQFARCRRNLIHSPPFLPLDRPQPGAIEAIERVQKAGVEVVILTMRTILELEAGLNCSRLGHLFPVSSRCCFGHDCQKTIDVEDKPKLMAKTLDTLPPASKTVMVGDTEADIIAAKSHGIPVIAVLCGIRDRERLAVHLPDAIVEDLPAAVDRLLQDFFLEAS
jgi:phosphoglycolate phosphatase-like HAD superfamily hydrolase